ncbi:MAG TPA: PilZ domain-containing protein [Desulfurivibrionaceae bacterium]|nr:PilZ domain-containing protein [Desulfurivibrionaceae bacterium]
MGKENRRSQRFRSNLPVTLLLRDNGSGASLTDPLHGQINDLSAHGVRLTVPHIRIGNHHLFYTFTDNQRQTIYLEIRVADLSVPPLCIPARPVWFDHILSEAAQPFQLGMEFLLPVDDEQIRRLKALLASKAGEGSWWQRLFGASAA